MNITVLLTRCRYQKPLAVLESEPFNGLEIRPAELLTLAQQLVAIADAAERAMDEKHWKPTRIEMRG